MSPSFWQILIVLAIIVLLFGPSRIPGLGKSLGQAIRGFKKGINEDEIDVTDSSKSEQVSGTDEVDKTTAEKTQSEETKKG